MYRIHSFLPFLIHFLFRQWPPNGRRPVQDAYNKHNSHRHTNQIKYRFPHRPPITFGAGQASRVLTVSTTQQSSYREGVTGTSHNDSHYRYRYHTLTACKRHRSGLRDYPHIHPWSSEMAINISRNPKTEYSVSTTHFRPSFQRKSPPHQCTPHPVDTTHYRYQPIKESKTTGKNNAIMTQHIFWCSALRIPVHTTTYSYLALSQKYAVHNRTS